MKWAMVCIENDHLEIQSIEIFEAEDEESAIKEFEKRNCAAAEFAVPYAHAAARWILMADYQDGESDIYLFPVIENGITPKIGGPVRYSPEILSSMSAEDMLVTIRELEPTKQWNLATPSHRGEDDTGYAIEFLHDGDWIHDPTTTSCGRFDADPVKDYGLSEDGAMALMVMNSILNERA